MTRNDVEALGFGPYPGFRHRTLLALDCETTSANKQSCRLVEVAAVFVNGIGFPEHGSFLSIVKPGSRISQGATDIHGITKEVTDQCGLPTDQALSHVARKLEVALHANMPVVVYNAHFDCTVISREMARVGGDGYSGALSVLSGTTQQIIDPLLMDRTFDKWRKGGRKLEDVAKHYGVWSPGAHSAGVDAVVAAQVFQSIVRDHKRHFVGLTLEQLYAKQVEWFYTWRTGFNKFLAKKGAALVTDEWPISEAA